MRTITVSEFRKNIKKYAEIAGKEKVIVNRGNGEAFAIVPIDAIEDEGYNPEFVKKILKAEKSVASGHYVEIKDTKNIWADILSE
jgi:PHD/YefM family antitoxin component YafN of YafNO toxin-antitoxin module